jgi:hypothetical protein
MKKTRKQTGPASGVERHRQRMRAAGFRPLQIWVPDTRSPKFAAECRRQSLRVAADAEEHKVMEALESGLDDVPDWKT